MNKLTKEEAINQIKECGEYLKRFRVSNLVEPKESLVIKLSESKITYKQLRKQIDTSMQQGKDLYIMFLFLYSTVYLSVNQRP